MHSRAHIKLHMHAPEDGGREIERAGVQPWTIRQPSWWSPSLTCATPRCCRRLLTLHPLWGHCSPCDWLFIIFIPSLSCKCLCHPLSSSAHCPPQPGGCRSTCLNLGLSPPSLMAGIDVGLIVSISSVLKSSSSSYSATPFRRCWIWVRQGPPPPSPTTCHLLSSQCTCVNLPSSHVDFCSCNQSVWLIFFF